MLKLARMRTLDECYAEIKKMDENTAIKLLVNIISVSLQ